MIELINKYIGGWEGLLDIFRKIIASVLTALYQPFWFATIFSILFMFLYMQAQEKGWNQTFKNWLRQFKNNVFFRRLFLLVLYTVMILFRTLINRDMWMNPVSNVIGVWGLYNKNGEFTTEIIENFILFIPFMILLLCLFKSKLLGEKNKLSKVIRSSIKITFLFSLSIEFLQLFLRIGTFQLSDLFFNTLGGLFGGLLYYFGCCVVAKKELEE